MCDFRAVQRSGWCAPLPAPLPDDGDACMYDVTAAYDSMGSPSAVPVPCISSPAMSLGSSPPSSRAERMAAW